MSGLLAFTGLFSLPLAILGAVLTASSWVVRRLTGDDASAA